jgi:hypothetical protein
MMRLGIKLITLALLLFALSALDVTSLRLAEHPTSAPGYLLLVSLLNAAVLSYTIVRSRWTGWPLVAAVFLIYYGVTVLQTAVEAVYLDFLIPVLPQLLINGGVTAAIFSVAAVWLHGRMVGEAGRREANDRLVMPLRIWLWKLPLLSIIWMVLFVAFGALVFLPLARWLDPEAVASYTSLELPSWILPFQALRGMLWVAFALPVIRMMKGRWRETALTVGMLFAVLMGGNLLVPNELLPASLQLAHAFEVMLENFVFGYLTVWLLLRVKRSRISAVPDGESRALSSGSLDDRLQASKEVNDGSERPCFQAVTPR